MEQIRETIGDGPDHPAEVAPIPVRAKTSANDTTPFGPRYEHGGAAVAEHEDLHRPAPAAEYQDEYGDEDGYSDYRDSHSGDSHSGDSGGEAFRPDNSWPDNSWPEDSWPDNSWPDNSWPEDSGREDHGYGAAGHDHAAGHPHESRHDAGVHGSGPEDAEPATEVGQGLGGSTGGTVHFTMASSARAATVVPTRTRGRRLPLPGQRPAGNGDRIPGEPTDTDPARPEESYPATPYTDEYDSSPDAAADHPGRPPQDQDHATGAYDAHAYRQTPHEYPSEADDPRPAPEDVARPSQHRPGGPLARENSHEPGVRGAGAHDRPDQPEGRPDGRLGADSAWRLLRRWRPGRRHSGTLDETSPQADLSGPATTVGPGSHPLTENPASPWAPIIIEHDQTGFQAGWTARPAARPPATSTGPAGEPEGWSPFAEAATTGPVPAAAVPVDSAEDLAADREALRRLGVPAAWTRLLQPGDRFTAIVGMLGRLAEHEIDYDADVIAVVGPAEVVELEAHRTALDLPEDGRPRAVAVLPHGPGTDLPAAFARAQELRPVVVAIPVAPHEPPADIRRLLTGLRAGATIAVVDAGRPIESITRWVEALEGVDALALDGTLDAETPAAVLGLGLPVIRVDGIPVDRVSWAALLCSQLAARPVRPALTHLVQ